MKIWCFFGVHELKVIARGPIVDRDRIKIGDYYHLQCSLCGKIKQMNLK